MVTSIRILKVGVLAMVFCLPLAGCFEAAMLGAAGGAGYLANNEIDKSVEKKKRAAQREEERKYQAALEQQKQIYQSKLPTRDEYISNQVTRSYMNGELTQVMSVTPVVQNGVVTLMGVVPSPVIADRAVEAARRIPGVSMVVSRLMIDERRIEPVLDRNGRQVRAPYPHMQQNAAPPAVPMYYPQQPRQQMQMGAAPMPMGYPVASPQYATPGATSARAMPVGYTPPPQPLGSPARAALPQLQDTRYTAMAIPVAAGGVAASSAMANTGSAASAVPMAPASAYNNNMRPLVPGGPEPTLPPAPPPAQVPLSAPQGGVVPMQQPRYYASPPVAQPGAVPAYPMQQPMYAVPVQQAYGPAPKPMNMQGLEDVPNGTGQDQSEGLIMRDRPEPRAGSREHWFPKWAP